jgi:hypothetical protein
MVDLLGGVGLIGWGNDFGSDLGIDIGIDIGIDNGKCFRNCFWKRSGRCFWA